MTLHSLPWQRHAMAAGLAILSLSSAACETEASGEDAVCGNGVLETGEDCDGTDLGANSCANGGTLACDDDCTLDESGCAGGVCGDGTLDAGEACDGAELGGSTCLSEGYDGGTLACGGACNLDFADCCSDAGCSDGDTQCGDDVVETCRLNAGGCMVWLPGEDCGSGGEICDDSSGSALCVSGCTNACPVAGAERCHGDVIESCALGTDGCLAWAIGQDCGATTQFCDASDPPAICSDTCVDQCPTLDVTRCSYTFVETCQAQGSGCNYWIETADCALTGDVCDDDGGAAACVACVDSCTADGLSQCDGDVVQTCALGALGCLEWSASENCAAGGEFCDDAGGTAACVLCLDQCTTDGDSRCVGEVIEDCELGLLGCLEWTPGTDCAAGGDLCDDSGGAAACVPPCVDSCPGAGDSQCAGDVVETCATGALGCLEWSPGLNCALTDEFCDDTGGAALCTCSDACDDSTDLPRCAGDSIEICALQANGCFNWQNDTDCTLTAEVCNDAIGTAACITAVGEDCGAAFALAGGVNTVTWTAYLQDYLTSAPSCVPSGIPSGPDLVLSYAATFDGFIDITIDKVTNNRIALVISNQACGTVNELDCLSEFAEAQLTGTLPVTAGTSYFFYLVDTTSGTGTLSNPLTVTIDEILCLDECTAADTQQCNGEVIETCTLGGLGCLEWVAGTDCSTGGQFCAAASGTPQCLDCQDTCPLGGETRCNGSSIEDCSENVGTGCYDWQATVDCSGTPDAVCDDTLGPAVCVLSTGEDCTSSYILTTGLNVVDWTATTQDHLLSSPSCASSYTLSGPDVVLRYTADFDGYIDWSMDKPTSTRYVAVASDEACGTLTPQLSCVTNSADPTMGDVFAVTTGTTYWFYLSDTTSGSNPLSDPFNFTLTPLACIDTCTLNGETRCVGSVLETCGVSPEGCLEWLPTQDCGATGGICDSSSGPAGCVQCLDQCSTFGNSRCTAGVVETCGVDTEGCLDWLAGADCGALGEVCFEAGSTASCAVPAGEDCSTAWPLVPGENTVDWVAFSGDYLTIAPGCQSTGGVSGPDVVLEYTAQSDGYVDMVMDKSANARFTFVVSDSACGGLTPQLGCASEYTATTMGVVFPVTAGATYFVYVVDTTDGAAPLDNPFTFGVYETMCPGGMADNDCPSVGTTACGALEVTETSMPNLAIPQYTSNATTCGGSGVGLSDSIVITQMDLIADVNVGINITHTYTGDLDIFLEFVDGVGTSHCVELSTDNGGSGDDFSGTVFDDEAALGIGDGAAPFTGAFSPEGSLASLYGLPMNGTWTLWVDDDVGGDSGTFNTWELNIAHGDSTIIQTCNLGGDGCLDWLPGVDCATSGDLCADASGTAQCLGCQDTCPTGGLLRCNGDLLETCSLNPQGCYDWALTTNCAAAGDFCDTTTGVATCLTPAGEDCTNAIPLSLGANTSVWVAYDQDYLTSRPSCQSSNLLVGPDVVLEYTATFDGDVVFSMAKPTSARFSAVVSDGPCGDTSELACVSAYSGTSMSTSFPVLTGETYYFYVSDTDSGSPTLPNPLEITLSCQNACSAGAQRCNGDVIQTCDPLPNGCLGWLDTVDCDATGDTCDDSGGAPVCAICTDLCTTANATRCSGDELETCDVGALGCLEWLVTTDCAAAGEQCEDTTGVANCYTALAEDCASVAVLSNGVNVIDWAAFNRDYLPDPVACSAGYSSVGPDLVVSYTAQNDGFLDLAMEKPTYSRFTVVVAENACGDITPEIACLSDYSNDSMGGLVPIFAGTTYYFYLVDTSDGSAPLPNPLVVSSIETTCPGGVAGDLCPADGATRCAPPTVVGTSAPGQTIADGTADATGCGATGATADTIVITDTDTIGSVRVAVDISHDWDSDLDIYLEFVDGSSTSHCVALSTDNGGTGADYAGTLFDDGAATAITSGSAPFVGAFRPEGSLASLAGLPMNGDWTLWVSDDTSGDVGTLNFWAVALDGATGVAIESCAVQGDGCLDWEQGVDCTLTGEYCNTGAGTAQCLPCEDTCPQVGDGQCNGEVVETCTVSGLGCVDWVAGTDCAASGDLCYGDGSSATCVPCFDNCPAPAATQCNGFVIESCEIGGLGCLEWTPAVDCDLSGLVCDQSTGTAACVACESSCATDGETRCAGDEFVDHAPALAIPDSGGNATTCGGAGSFASDSIITVRSEVIADVEVMVDITHTFDSDLDIFLGFVDGGGTPHCVELATDVGGGGDDFTATVFDDDATTAITSGAAPFTGSFAPEGSLASLNGLPMNGTWTLYVSDDVGSDVGTLNLWSLRVSYAGTVIETCTLQSNGCRVWTGGTDCADGGELCNDGSGSASCAACLDSCPSAGDERCNGDVVESCNVGALGCLEWQATADCPAISPGDICVDSSGTATCLTPLGEDCASPFPLATGVNNVAWTAFTNDYLTATPSCQTVGTTSGPDVVLEWTAASTGAADLTIDKPASTRYSVVVSDSPCGTVTELACYSEYIATTMGGTFPATAGTTYYFYVIDTSSGTNPLANPLTVTIGCADGCPGSGEARCTGDTVETCQVGSLGCLEWQVTDDCAAGGQVCEDFGGVAPYCSDCNNTCVTNGETQCNGTVIETCSPDGLGCLTWTAGTDCATTSEVCVDSAGSAACVLAGGSSCSDAFVLSAGTNQVAWNATTQDYLTSAPSCTTSVPDGPDVVLEYTASSAGAGFVELVMDKPTNTRYVMVGSDAACGTVTELGCFEDYANATLSGILPVTGGTTYYLYVVDTTFGSNPLLNPFNLTVTESDCAIFAATPTNELPANGTTTSSLSPVLSIDFDQPLDTSLGVIAVDGDLGTSLSYDLATGPAEIFFTNGDRTLNVDPGVSFPAGEQVSVTWTGLQDLNCGNPVNTLTWDFVIVNPSCVPGVGGVVGTTQTRVGTGIASFTEYYVVADDDPSGWVYFGGLANLYRYSKSGGGVEDVEALAGLSSSQMGYAMLVAGSQIFTLESTTGASGRLWRISADGGVSWAVEDFADFSAVNPADDFRSAVFYGGRIYLATHEGTTGTDTEIWSVSATPGSLPDPGVLEVTFPELYCAGLAMDDLYYYLACGTGERVVRVDRTTGVTDLLTTNYDLSATVNVLYAQDLGSDGVADVLYLQHTTEEVQYFCDPAATPFTDNLISFGTGTGNYGLGFDSIANALWVFDDDVQELVEIQ